ncbi:hypothetical protein Tco_0777651, partial [Tanacetum coccineum]
IQEGAEIQGRASADTEILLDQEEPTELVEDLGSGEKGEKEISTVNILVSTASATPEKKAKKQLDQERLGHEEAIRLQEQINEEERQRIARDAEIAKQLQKEFDKARQEQKVVVEADQAHDIDWSDPAVLRYHALQNSSFSVVESIKKNDDSQQQVGSSKNRSREDSDEDNAKKQKLEDDAKKEELKDSIDVVPRDDIAIDVESLATKYPIARCDGSAQTGTRKNKYPLTQEMLSRMLSRRLEVDQESEMAFELLRRDLQLEDAEGTECLPTDTIFEELTRMGYEKLTQKLAFYKAFFSPQWKFLIHINLKCLSAKTTA